VTAITDRDAPEEVDEAETLPAITLKSDFSQEPFSLFVRLPKSYPKDNTRTYPVIYLLDGNAYFDAIANFTDTFVKKKKDFDDPIIVGIGYDNAYVMDSLRNRDYTYPLAIAADSFKISGQGDRFYEFIKSRVIPTIDSMYRTDKGNRTIAGHSLGGYFVLYSMLRQINEPTVFTNFVAASPSLYYHDKYLIKEIERNPALQKNIENGKLYLTFGELETSENRSDDFGKLSDVLMDKAISVRTEVYKTLEHMDTAIPTFEDGIKLFISKRNFTYNKE
jgi:predicted alpha/beta superfamily hydrolase